MADAPTWHRVAAASQVAEGEAVAVRVGDRQIALCRAGGTLHAFENVCPHAYALLSDGFVEGEVVECPLHAARFSIVTGECLSGPAPEGIATYEVRIENDGVFVRVPGSASDPSGS
jgi:NAD(P)H-dependent nitrite reductase small subunit